ncbi:hypothetical protein JCM16358_06300 [Halanaerocella petrolearia]
MLKRRNNILIVALALLAVISVSSTTSAFFLFDWLGAGDEKASLEDRTSLKDVEFEAALPLKTDVPKQIKRIKAYKKINQLRHQEEIDFEAIEKVYNDVLKATVQSRDEKFATTMDQYIQAAFRGVENGQDPALAAQIVDKTLKRAFYLSVKHEIDEVVEYISNKEKAHHKLDEAIVYYEAVAGTAKEYSKDSNEGILSGLKTIRQAIENDKVQDVEIAGQIVDKTIVKVFYDSVLHEVEEVEEYITEKPDKAAIKQMEGLVYYQAIKDKVEGTNKIGNQIIQEQFNGQLEDVDYEFILEEMNRGFATKVYSYLEEVEENWGTNKAVIEAWEALLYYNVFTDHVEANLGTGVESELVTNLRSYVNAVEQTNRAKADTLAEEIRATLRDYVGTI